MHDPSRANQELIEKNSLLEQRIQELEILLAECKQENNALRESEEQYRTLLSESSDPTFSFTPEGQYRYVNRAFAEGVGKPVADIIGKSIWDVFDKEEADKRFAPLSQVFSTGNEKVIEVRVPRVDGDRYYMTTITPVKDTEGKVLSALCSSKEITARKRTENALLESEEKFKVLANSTPTAVMLYQDDHWIYANSAAQAICGYSEKELLAMNFWDIVHPKAREIIKQEGRKRQQGEETTNRHEFKIVAKDGTEKWVDLSGASTTLHGRLAGIVSVLDITERKRIEKALLESQRRLADIVDFLPDATLVVDKDGKVIAWNRAMETMTGIKKEEMIGKSDYEYALPFYGDRRPILVDLALHPDQSTENEYNPIQRSNGNLFGEAFTPKLSSGKNHFSGTASVLRDDKGQIVAAIECIRDNTERKQLEERLNRAEKMEALGTLAGGVAHDLNNVLGVLVGYSELLKMELPEDSLSRTYADNILQSSVRGAAIIQDLLTMARRGVTVSQVVNLNTLIIDYLKTPEMEKMIFFHPDVKILSELDAGLLPIKGSPVHLGKTIANLISNAAEAISGNGEITIKTENRYLDRPVKGYDEMAEGDFAVLTVSDTGAGISADDLGKIFEPFYTKKVMGRSGTGLGLTVVWGTVKDHHGYIDVHSKEGEGTTFTLYFPVTREEQAKIEKVVSPAAYEGRGESILMVDDVKEQRALAMNMLTSLGYDVAAVASGEEAVEYVRQRKVDLILLDMIMEPGIDGLETYRRILDLHPEQKAIIVSGFSETDRVKQAQDMGAGSFVQKPYIMEKIGLAIRTELDRK